MEYMTIGKQLAGASRLALGCMRMASLSVEQAAQVLQTTAEVGINFYDHADIYGAGESESRFAQALKQVGIARDQVLLQSKCGIRKGFFDFSKEHIIDSVEKSLSRLETDYLDVLLLHRPDTLMEPEEVAAAFNHLHQAGKVRYFGVSNHHPLQVELLKQAVQQPLIINQLEFGPAHTPMIDAGLNVNMRNDAGIVRDSNVLEYSRLQQMTIQPWSPFQVDLTQGLFMNHPDYQALTQCIQQLADQYEVSFEAMVMVWILRHPAQMQPIVGSMNSERIQAMAQATAVQLTRQEWYAIYLSAGNQLP